MKNKFEKPEFTATGMGNVPYKGIKAAVDAVLENFPEAPCLPVTSRTMKWMLEGIPCLVFDRKKRQVLMDPSPEREGEILEFYERYENNDLDFFATTFQAAPFYYEMLEKLKRTRPPGLKWIIFQTAGPLILGDMIKQLDGNPVLYHETLRDIVIKGSNIKARWLEKKIKEEIPGIQVIPDLPETTLVNFTSAGGTGTREDIINAINGSFEGLAGPTWVHCCANIDWSLLTSSNVDIINFDAYQHSERVALYTEEFKDFLGRGGMLGWGIVPTSRELISKETVQTLVERLQEGIKLFVSKGIDEKLLASSSWILPACDTVLLTPEQSNLAFKMTREISSLMKRKYGFDACE